jgi:hypothetical protein
MKHPENDLRHFGQIATVIVYGVLVLAFYSLQITTVKRSLQKSNGKHRFFSGNTAIDRFG